MKKMNKRNILKKSFMFPCGKRGQFFALYLVLLTLLMCGLVIFVYFIQDRNVSNSLASPVALLRLQDNKEMYELQENKLISDAIKEAEKSESFGTSGFNNKFSEIFFNSLNKPEQKEFRAFMFSNTIDQLNNDFFNNIYKISFSNNLIVQRVSLEKNFIITASDKNKINFPVFVSYSYSKTWSCNKEGVCS